MVDRPTPVPDLDWTPAQADLFTARVAALWSEVLSGIRSRELPVTRQHTVDGLRESMAIDVPDVPMGDDALIAYLRELALERSSYMGHPRFLAYVSGAGTVPGAAADLLASGLNMNAGGWGLGAVATEIEMHLCRWFAQEVFGLPGTSGGELTSGGALANFIALKVARDRRATWDVRNEGVGAGPALGFYLSSETHEVSLRAADMLGVGWQNVRKIRARPDYRFDVDALREQIREDREAGIQPAVVVATAGTVLTGVVDPLDELADLCAEVGMWLHVDAAYGGPAMLAEDLRPQFVGIERADSIAFDPHKWLYTPHPGGCVLVRNFGDLRGSFDVFHLAYVHESADPSEKIDLGRIGPNFSRSFQSLKVWVSLLAHGRDAYARRISHDAELARYLGALAEEHPAFELCTPVGLSITVFRYVPPDLRDDDGRGAYLDALNARLVEAIQADGRVFVSNAELQDGTFALRSCVVNYRTEAEDMEAVLAVAEELGARLDLELRPEDLR